MQNTSDDIHYFGDIEVYPSDGCWKAEHPDHPDFYGFGAFPSEAAANLESDIQYAEHEAADRLAAAA